MEYQKQTSHDIEQNHRTSLSKLLPNHQMGLSMWVSVIYVGVMPQLYLNILSVISRLGLSEEFHLIAILMRKTMIYFTMFKKELNGVPHFHLPFCSISSAPRLGASSFSASTSVSSSGSVRKALLLGPLMPRLSAICWSRIRLKAGERGEVWRTWRTGILPLLTRCLIDIQRKRGESEEM